ncbi:methanethiol S-methyltransferase [Methylobacterium nodulans]|nr:methanethiol S-methyltransferase [Methylobacterium nodulans]
MLRATHFACQGSAEQARSAARQCEERLTRLLGISGSPSQGSRTGRLIREVLDWAEREPDVETDLLEVATMGRTSALLYGLVAYVLSLIAFVYAIGFVENAGVSKTIDSGEAGSFGLSLLIDMLLLSLFAVQHSLMARPFFKRWWLKVIPAPVERSTYVLCASSALLLLFWQWRPLPAEVFSVQTSPFDAALIGLSLFGWGLALVSTFLISHFELFGLRQVYMNFIGRDAQDNTFKITGLYNVVRHPIYLGFIIAFWATPQMTVGRLLFALVTTAYIMVGIAHEEKDLIAKHGDQYRQYKRQVAMLFPFRVR